ncbi:MAG: hypothetical protein RL685_3062 [Pseudomonadota bacterium]|jgi:protein required for attachment to host cells
MNLNSLIIVADAARARLFRTGQTNAEAAPVELIEVDTVELHGPRLEGSKASDPHSAAGAPTVRGESRQSAERRCFADQIAEKVAKFAQYHFCNPIIVAADHEMAALIIDEVERQVRDTYVRSFIGDFAEQQPHAILAHLQERGAFSPVLSIPAPPERRCN